MYNVLYFVNCNTVIRIRYIDVYQGHLQDFFQGHIFSKKLLFKIKIYYLSSDNNILKAHQGKIKVENSICISQKTFHLQRGNTPGDFSVASRLMVK